MKEEIIASEDTYCITVDNDLPGWLNRVVERAKQASVGTERVPVTVVRQRGRREGVAIVPLSYFAKQSIAGLDQNDPLYEQAKEWITRNWGNNGKTKP